MQLEPAVTFNAAEVWKHELLKQEAHKQESTAAASSGPTKKKDQMKEKNAEEQDLKRFTTEVTRIRNSKANLLSLLREVKIPDSRMILYIQILKNAYDEFSKNQNNLKYKKLLYEVVWALNEMDLPQMNAPQPLDKKLLAPNIKDHSLVYDNYKDAFSLLKSANKLIAKEEDLIRLQLVDMSDSLPPLSKFSSGFKLDPWQKRVLTWIDAGKSVVISAPTSSGKTVLSSYVAIIFKSFVSKEETIEESTGSKKIKGKPTQQPQQNNKNARDEDMDADMDDDEEFEAIQMQLQAQAFSQQEDKEAGEGSADDQTAKLIEEDKKKRLAFLKLKKELQMNQKNTSGSNQRVLFVVPTEPLVWQVSAYFTKLMKEEGDRQTRVALVTDQLVFRPQNKLDVVPQIVVGTPLALESALTKSRGLTGHDETKGKAAGNILPGGFDHYDWVIYDEVHALDGTEGAALQRLIRSMNCPFLALSATIGNAEQLRSWMEMMKGEQLRNVETVTVTNQPVAPSSSALPVPPPPQVSSTTTSEGMDFQKLRIVGHANELSFRIGLMKTLLSEVMIYDQETTYQELYNHLQSVWSEVALDLLDTSTTFSSHFNSSSNENEKLEQLGLHYDVPEKDRVVEVIPTLQNVPFKTIVGQGAASPLKLSISQKFTFHLPAIQVAEDCKTNEIYTLLEDIMKYLVDASLKERNGVRFLIKGTTNELKDDSVNLFEALTASKGRDKDIETSLLLGNLQDSNADLMNLINTWNMKTTSVTAEGGAAVKSFAVKFNVALFYDSMEVIYFNTSTVGDLKTHLFQLWNRKFYTYIFDHLLSHFEFVSNHISFRSAKLLENHPVNRFGLFHPSVNDTQRILDCLVHVKTLQNSVGVTVIGKANQSISTITVKKDLSNTTPSEVLVTKEISLKEIKNHLEKIWSSETLQLFKSAGAGKFNFFDKEKNVIHSLEKVASQVVSGSHLQLLDSEETKKVPHLAAQLTAVPHFRHLTVIGKGTQRPYRIKLIRTNGNIHEANSSISMELMVFQGTTVLELKQQICTLWPDLQPDSASQASHIKYPVQLLHENIDLLQEDQTLASYRIIEEGSNNEIDSMDNEKPKEIIVRSLVHLLVHQGRFINLQRFVWDQSQKTKSNRLQPISPLAAISTAEELAGGILHNSSLSFTSKDCFRTFEEMKKVSGLPKEVLEKLSPYTFFDKKERITLQKSKEYEDFLKYHLTLLAKEYPTEIQQLLNKFQVKPSSREFNLCDLVLELRDNDMLPVLPFHLNTFEAIKLFQQLLSDLEYRQKCAYPTYYMDLKSENDSKQNQINSDIKSQGKNDKAVEELMKTVETVSSVDLRAPHPNFTACKGSPLSSQELEELVDDMERYDGFEKRDATTMREAKGQNESILNHALIRGLRRGIGLFIDEVSFPSYRRAIQKLSSTGKLGVVISDGSLAFGVNMPFRTCVFCNEMNGTLDELMAQQMSGRAGRRGLDEQGNVIYAGLRLPMLKRLMIGKIANITGRKCDTKYDTMFTQAILSPRHTGYHRVDVLGGQTLTEFIDQTPETPENTHYSMTVSRQIMMDLDFVTINSQGNYIPKTSKQSNYGLLTAIWEMRNHVSESITIGMLLPDIIEEFSAITKELRINEKKTNTEKMEPLIYLFFVIMVQLIRRSPATKHTTKLLDLNYFSHHPEHLKFYEKWSRKFAEQQERLRSKGYGHLCSPIAPGTELDGTFFQCAIDRHHVFSLDENLKQEMKLTLWHVGNVLRILNNASVIENAYHRVGHFVFKNAFQKLKYLNSELIGPFIDFPNVAAADSEKRTDKNETIPKPMQAEEWTDLNRSSWQDAISKFSCFFFFSSKLYVIVSSRYSSDGY
jgi:hypothetical protein